MRVKFPYCIMEKIIFVTRYTDLKKNKLYFRLLVFNSYLFKLFHVFRNIIFYLFIRNKLSFSKNNSQILGINFCICNLNM